MYKLLFVSILLVFQSCALLLDGTGTDENGTTSLKDELPPTGNAAASSGTSGVDGKTKKTRATLAQIINPNSKSGIGACIKKQGVDCQLHEFKQLQVISETFIVKKDKEGGDRHLYGFYAVDPEELGEDGRLGPYSGIKVVVSPHSRRLDSDIYFLGEEVKFPKVGDLLSLSGEVQRFYGEPQLTMLTKMQFLKNDETLPEPALFDGNLEESDSKHPQVLASERKALSIDAETVSQVDRGELVSAYIGTLVEVKNVETVEACSAIALPFKGPTSLSDFGNFRITGNIEVGTLFRHGFGGLWPKKMANGSKTCALRKEKCQDSRAEGQVFERIVGIIDLSFGVHRLQPRTDKDFSPDSLFVEQDRSACE